MKNLEKLRAVKDINGLAKLLGFQPKNLAFILYKLPDAVKYTEFEISKKGGGVRKISKPEPRLMLAQKRLAELLLRCIQEIEAENTGRKSLSHAFQKKRSIVTNATPHTNRRYVLNIDLQDFFETINFGRVRGFFIKDRNFSVPEKTATLIAQIACFNNSLPQGSPCSPVISNLVGHIIDVRMAKLAKVYKCTYSRYADDITFSTNRKKFPTPIARRKLFSESIWVVGKDLKKEIKRLGFTVNTKKTRMQIRGSRQETTGLTVNAKVNIKQEYYRRVRSMCHELFKSGEYYLIPKGEEGHEESKTKKLKKLEGMLAHIDYVKQRRHVHGKGRKHLPKLPDQPKELFEKFLFFKTFVVLKKPLILTEGKTDIVYLRCAIKKLNTNFPEFYNEGKYSLQFYKSSHIKKDVLNIAEGSSSFHVVINRYAEKAKRYKHKPMNYPVIMLVDNDQGAKQVFSAARRLSGDPIAYNTTEPFYFLGENLYLVKTPESGNSQTCIENCFDADTLALQVDGKSFDMHKEHGDHQHISKQVFATQISLTYKDRDMTGFIPLLDRINAVLSDYAVKRSQA